MFVQLGRYGDIFNVLPILHEENRSGRRPTLMVCRDYADVMDGVSYCDVVTFEGKFEELPQALELARTMSDEVVCCQVYGHGYAQERVCESFAVDSWNNAGYFDRWGELPLVIDRRDRSREKELLARFPGVEEFVLCVTSGHSSPFKFSNRLRSVLNDAFPGRVLLLDDLRCFRPYDLLALFDRAKVLVSIDTMHLHLAPASKIPVVALFTDKPTTWHGAPFRAGQVYRVRYDEYRQCEEGILNAVERCLS